MLDLIRKQEKEKTQAEIEAGIVNEYQEKFVGSAVTTDQTVITFNNLETGKTYRYTIFFNGNSSSNDDWQITSYNNGAQVRRCFRIQDNPGGMGVGSSYIFVAAGPNLMFNIEGMNGFGTLGGGQYDSWGQLEELPNHVVKSQRA